MKLKIDTNSPMASPVILRDLEEVKKGFKAEGPKNPSVEDGRLLIWRPTPPTLVGEIDISQPKLMLTIVDALRVVFKENLERDFFISGGSIIKVAKKAFDTFKMIDKCAQPDTSIIEWAHCSSGLVIKWVVTDIVKKHIFTAAIVALGVSNPWIVGPVVVFGPYLTMLGWDYAWPHLNKTAAQMVQVLYQNEGPVTAKFYHWLNQPLSAIPHPMKQGLPCLYGYDLTRTLREPLQSSGSSIIVSNPSPLDYTLTTPETLNLSGLLQFSHFTQERTLCLGGYDLTRTPREPFLPQTAAPKNALNRGLLFDRQSTALAVQTQENIRTGLFQTDARRSLFQDAKSLIPRLPTASPLLFDISLLPKGTLPISLGFVEGAPTATLTSTIKGVPSRLSLSPHMIALTVELPSPIAIVAFAVCFIAGDFFNTQWNRLNKPSFDERWAEAKKIVVEQYVPPLSPEALRALPPKVLGPVNEQIAAEKEEWTNYLIAEAHQQREIFPTKKAEAKVAERRKKANEHRQKAFDIASEYFQQCKESYQRLKELVDKKEFRRAIEVTYLLEHQSASEAIQELRQNLSNAEALKKITNDWNALNDSDEKNESRLNNIIEHCEKATSQRNLSNEAKAFLHTIKANCYEEKSEYEQAIKEHQTVLKFDPKHSNSLIAIANLHLQKGDLPEAMHSLENDSVRNDPRSLYLKAIIYYQQGEYKKARQSCEQYYQLNPDDTDRSLLIEIQRKQAQAYEFVIELGTHAVASFINGLLSPKERKPILLPPVKLLAPLGGPSCFDLLPSNRSMTLSTVQKTKVESPTTGTSQAKTHSEIRPTCRLFDLPQRSAALQPNQWLESTTSILPRKTPSTKPFFWQEAKALPSREATDCRDSSFQHSKVKGGSVLLNPFDLVMPSMRARPKMNG